MCVRSVPCAGVSVCRCGIRDWNPTLSPFDLADIGLDTHTVSSLTTHHHHHLLHPTHALQFKDVAKLDEAAIDAAINGGGEAKQ